MQSVCLSAGSLLRGYFQAWYVVVVALVAALMIDKGSPGAAAHFGTCLHDIMVVELIILHIMKGNIILYSIMFVSF